MKQIQIFLAAAAVMFMAVSCYQREYVPQTGAVEVEFPSDRVEVSLAEYIYLPIQQVEKSTTGAKAIYSYDGGTVTLTDGTTREVVVFKNNQEGYENGGDIIFTDESGVLYIRGYDPEDPTESSESFIPSADIEIRVPSFSRMRSLELQFTLVGEYLSPDGNNTVTFVASR